MSSAISIKQRTLYKVKNNLVFAFVGITKQ